MTARGEMLDSALVLAARGVPVFPLTPKAKTPLGILVPHGLKDASTDPATIRAWWRRCPSANVGAVTGIVFDALDVDGPEGWDQLARMVAEHGCLPGGPVSLTGSGGAHYLMAPTGLGNRTGIRPHLDWRGTGGYIVAPPSVHPNGTRYEWAVDLDQDPIRPAPSWLVALLKPPPVDHPAPSRVGHVDPGRYGRAALEQEVGRLLLAPVGQRNDQLNRSAHALGQLVAGGALGIEMVVDCLLDAARRLGLADDEIERTMTSGLRAGMARPRRLSA